VSYARKWHKEAVHILFPFATVSPKPKKNALAAVKSVLFRMMNDKSVAVVTTVGTSWSQGAKSELASSELAELELSCASFSCSAPSEMSSL
jgi:hypothetical protein